MISVQESDGPVIEIDNGSLRGLDDGTTRRFLGIPYGKVPDGARRFCPPEPADPWDGRRDATRTAPVCPQNPSLMDALFGGETEQWHEDCLHLNVFTPSNPVGDAGGLPVMVWIHGGGFEMGSGSSPLYDGSAYSRRGVVLVTLNYRLGSLGFLELGHLDPAFAGSGSVGLLDQVLALEWVQRNIAAFGGDPDNVTIFGESAGAMSVSMLMTMPRARGLFHRAIAQSGSAHAAMSSELAAATTDEFLDHLGIAARGPEAVAELQQRPVQDLLAAHAAMSAARIGDPLGTVRRTGTPLAFLSFRPVAEGTHLPVDPLAELESGAAADIPLVIGSTAEEWNLFSFLNPPPADDAQMLDRMGVIVDDPEHALAAYRDAAGDDATRSSLKAIECAFLTDRVFRIPALRQADAQMKHAPVWQYLWAWRSPALGGLIGASHAIELPFVFDLVEDHRLHVFVGPDAPADLAAAICDAWCAFARDGVPNVDGVDWPTIDTDPGEGRPVLVWDTERRVETNPDAVTRRFWEGRPI